MGLPGHLRLEDTLPAQAHGKSREPGQPAVVVPPAKPQAVPLPVVTHGGNQGQLDLLPRQQRGALRGLPNAEGNLYHGDLRLKQADLHPPLREHPGQAHPLSLGGQGPDQHLRLGLPARDSPEQEEAVCLLHLGQSQEGLKQGLVTLPEFFRGQVGQPVTDLAAQAGLLLSGGRRCGH